MVQPTYTPIPVKNILSCHVIIHYTYPRCCFQITKSLPFPPTTTTTQITRHLCWIVLVYQARCLYPEKTLNGKFGKINRFFKIKYVNGFISPHSVSSAATTNTNLYAATYPTTYAQAFWKQIIKEMRAIDYQTEEFRSQTEIPLRPIRRVMCQEGDLGINKVMFSAESGILFSKVSETCCKCRDSRMSLLLMSMTWNFIAQHIICIPFTAADIL